MISVLFNSSSRLLTVMGRVTTVSRMCRVPSALFRISAASPRVMDFITSMSRRDSMAGLSSRSSTWPRVKVPPISLFRMEFRVFHPVSIGSSL